MRLMFGLALGLLLGNGVATARTQTEPVTKPSFDELTPQFGESAVAWAKAQTALTRTKLESSPNFKIVMADIGQVHSRQRVIPSYHLLGGRTYFRTERDGAHPYGRISVTDALANGRPRENWRTVLDLDAFNRARAHPYSLKILTPEKECLKPDFDRCMIPLYADGGQDNIYVELDMRTGQIVENGFRIPPGRNAVTWFDKDTLLVAHTTNGAKVMPSKFPAQLYTWRRGNSLSEARKIFELDPKDTFFDFFVTGPASDRHVIVNASKTYTTSQLKEILPNGTVADIPLPLELKEFGTPVFMSGKLAVQLSSSQPIGGKLYPADSVVAYDYSTRRVSIVMTPPKTAYLSGGISGAENGFAVVGVRNMQRILYFAMPTENGWMTQERLEEPAGVMLKVKSDEMDEAMVLEEEGLITPSQLRYLGRDSPILIDRSASQMDLSDFIVDIKSAIATDGVSVDYYLLHKKNARGPVPTILQGFGGFGYSNDPSYFCCRLGASWKSWFDRGGALAIAGGRGGGERGGAWHVAGAGIHKKTMFDDFNAIAATLVRTGFTDAAHLGAIGHSNGGLLVAGAIVLRPDLYGAALMSAPLTDFSIIGHGDGGIGAGMAAEFGNWDNPSDRPIMQRWDPFSNVKIGVRYPAQLMVVSTTNGQIGPGHARRFVAKMQGVGADAKLLEGQQGGHDYPDEYTETSDVAMQMSWLMDTLMDDKMKVRTSSPQAISGAADRPF